MNWQILITDFLGGFAPKWYGNAYPAYGNKNQAGNMLNTDLTDPNVLQPGPGLASLINGTQAAAVTTLMRSVFDSAVTSGITYGVGGNKLYQISPTTVTSSGTWPHTISSAGAEDGEGICYFQGNLYYLYNETGSIGDIGKYDLAVTFTDTWGSTVPTGKANLVGGVPHQAIIGTTSMWFTNGRYVGQLNGTSGNLVPQALDLGAGWVTQSIVWTSSKLWITANNPGVTGTNKNTASIFLWNGTDPSWEAEIRLTGAAGALHVKNGTVFVFYQDVSNVGGFKLAYINGTVVTDLANLLRKLAQVLSSY